MQTLSHKTRAFLVNAQGLKGFLERYRIDEILDGAQENGEFEEVAKYHTIDSADRLEIQLNMKNFFNSLHTIGKMYPCLAIYLMEKSGRINDLKRYMENC